MSLQVWLPLNGDLNNYGVSNINNITGTNISFVDGKIGKCCKMGYTSDFTIPAFDKAKQISIAYWCKVNTATSSQWLDMFHFKASDGTNTYWCRQELYSNCTYSGYFADAGGSINGIPCTIGEWIHYAITLNFETGEAKVYKNGILFNQNSNINTSYYILSTNFRLGENGLDLSQNDFRIYDHILTPKEVKEISKTLVCHYPLDNNGIGNPNLAKGTNTASTGTNVFGYGEQTGGSSRIIEYDGGIPCAKITRNTTAHSGWAYLYYDNLDVPAIKTSTTYTVSFDVIASGVGNIGWNGFMMGNATNSLSQSLTTIQNTFNADTWSHIVFQVTTKSSFDGITVGSQLVYMNTAYLQGTGTWLKMKNMKVEEGIRDTPWCPHTSDAIYSTFNINGTTEFDTSGFKNNGTRNAVTVVSDSPRYSCATKFDGSTSFIACGRGGMVTDEITISLWAYKLSWSSFTRPISCTEGGGWNFEDNGTKIQFPVGTGTTSNTYKTVASTIDYTSLSAGWHMFSGTYDGLALKLYIDGILNNTTTAFTTKTPIFYNSANGIFIGAEAGGNQTTPAGGYFNGNISDVRIYATALSADDIKQLYQASASIDNGGNVLAYDIQEK